MTIDVNTEVLLRFEEARDCFPGRSKLSLATLHRWRLHGVRGVKLETVLVGDRRFTSRQAIQRFVENQNCDARSVVTISPSQRRTQAEAANQILIDAGF